MVDLVRIATVGNALAQKLTLPTQHRAGGGRLVGSAGSWGTVG